MSDQGFRTTLPSTAFALAEKLQIWLQVHVFGQGSKCGSARAHVATVPRREQLERELAAGNEDALSASSSFSLPLLLCCSGRAV